MIKDCTFPIFKSYYPAIEQFQTLMAELQSSKVSGMEHGELELLIEKEGREILRRLLQGHLDQRKQEEPEYSPILGKDQKLRNRQRLNCKKHLATIFGEVAIRRRGYSSSEASGLFPLDAELNLPPDKYSDELRRRISIEASRNSFEDCADSVEQTTGTKIPKRQSEEITKKVAQDFDDFYQSRSDNSKEETKGVVVLTTDGKGIVMAHEDLREATRKAAEKEAEQPAGARLSPGKKKNRKRMASVASVYSIEPQVRTAEEIMGVQVPEKEQPKPKPQNKRTWASVERSPEEVTREIFEEAVRRDPKQKLPWVVLLDGDPRQLDRIEKESKERGLKVTIILDLIHVLEYLWKASYSLYEVGSQAAETWVRKQIMMVLKGNSSRAAASMRRSATIRNLSKQKRLAIDKCANYLIKYRDYLQYNTYCRKGFPIATGVIEGACRYLVKDRMEITGARWRLKGAEAVLKLRSLRVSNDFEEYWQFHKAKELERNHLSLYQEPPEKIAA